MCTDRFHAIILRGDINNVANNYTISGQQPVTTFLQYGGTYKFRQVTEAINTLVFEVTPTHVNIPTSLRVGGYTGGIRTFVSCAVSAAGTLYWSRGQQTVTVQRTIGGYAWGDYTVSWSAAHPDGADYVPQFCALNFWGFIHSGNRTATSIQIKATDGSGGVIDRDFCLTIH